MGCGAVANTSNWHVVERMAVIIMIISVASFNVRSSPHTFCIDKCGVVVGAVSDMLI